MKKLFPILMALALFLSACQLGGQAQPTAIALPTAFPTNTPAVNAPAEAGGSAGSERASSVDGMPQVYIPDGTFRMGGLDNDVTKDEQPAHSVTLKGFWIDKLEVTNTMYLMCVNAGACEPPQHFKSDTRESCFNNAEFNDYPVIYVSGCQG
ncbi:MAG: SUMF1/EgtB/PvdO family nonheme iron enzyme [Anaerolineales bacterium]|nr:SUMF1/EgtB/PvdO family nonheme iron enzyme [Anaerolineales bacterium]